MCSPRTTTASILRADQFGQRRAVQSPLRERIRTLNNHLTSGKSPHEPCVSAIGIEHSRRRMDLCPLRLLAKLKCISVSTSTADQKPLIPALTHSHQLLCQCPAGYERSVEFGITRTFQPMVIGAEILLGGTVPASPLAQRWARHRSFAEYMQALQPQQA